MSIFTKKGALHAADYWAVVRRRWRVILGVFAASLSGAIYVNIATPPIFRAKATLMINPDMQQSIVGPVNAYVAEMNEDVSIATQLWIIRSDPIAEGVVRRLGLTDEERNPEEFRNFITNVARNLFVERIQGTRLFEIQAQSNKGSEAASLANATAEVFIEQAMQAKFDASRRSISWLTEQIIQMRKKLEDAETALLDYQRRENLGSVGLSPELQEQKLSDLQSQFIETQTESNSLRSQITQIRALLSAKDLPAVPTGLSTTLDELNRQLTVNELSLDKLRIELKEKHPRVVRLEEETNVIRDRMRKELSRYISTLESKNESVQSREKVLAEALESLNRSALDASEKQIEVAILRRDIDTYRELYNMLIKKSKAADITRGVGESNFRIVEYAQTPRWPIRPRKNRNIFMGFLIGLVMGSAVAFLMEYLDRTIRTPEDIEQSLGLPLLVAIPRVSSSHTAGVGSSIFITAEKKHTPEAESFHALRTSLRFAQNQQGLRCLLITSSSPSEGKTTVSINLSLSFASVGIKTILVDADLRKPRIHTIFGRPNDRGLSNCMEGNISSYVQKTDFENLDVLTSGPHVTSPFEVLENTKTNQLFAKLREQYEMVIVDSPPIGSVVDAALLSGQVDGVVFILQSGRIEAMYAQHAIEQLEKVQAKLLGVVLNSLEREASQYYYTYYYRGYYGEKAKDILRGITDSARRG